ncbi:uncharacterized protein LOC117644575 [Thrips palmi]|uniref:Uncharacterized protein LOC117644575 n=1 Tax=Thrips palmi TaxID=161013 RepID=A0A6P8Z0F1_THRPL|nr:uncharacterized protein LOC117644575 [Thrips palmi]
MMEPGRPASRAEHINTDCIRGPAHCQGEAPPTNMNTAVVVLAVALVAQVYAAPPPFMKKCMEDNGVTMEDAIKFGKTGEASDNMKCNLKCMMLAGGAMKEDGTLVMAPMLEHAPEKLHDAIKQCIDIEKSSDLCDVAYRHNKCIRDKATDVFIELAEKKAAMAAS